MRERVIVSLPCNVGDDLYCLFRPVSEETKIIHIVIDTFEIHKDYIVIEGYSKTDNQGYCYRYFVKEIGKSVFFTREEAEKALKRGATNG